MEKKVLILEDNDKTALLLKQLLEECGSPVKIYIEKDIEQAYALVMQNRIQLFVIDIILDISKAGDTSGIRFAEAVRSITKYKYTPMIFITSLQDPEIYAYRELHCYGYIEKPFAIEQVKKQLAEALECNISVENDCMLHFRKDGILYPIEDALGQFKAVIRKVNPAFIFYDFVVESDKALGWFDFKSYGLDEQIYNVMYLLPVEGKLMHGIFNCLYRDILEWKEAVHQIMMSVTDLTQKKE